MEKYLSMDSAMIISIFFNLLAICLGAYFHKYLAKKGEITALDENFKTIKSQLTETTNLTKNIEARIN